MPKKSRRRNDRRQQRPAPIDQVVQAVLTGDRDQVRRFITAGGNVNDIPTFFPPGYTLLMCACEKDYDCARLLIENGADVNKRRTDDGSTALFAASYCGNVDCMRLLIENGAEVNTGADDGMNPLHIASQNGDVDGVRLLIENCADVNNATKRIGNEIGAKPHHLASQEGHV